MNQQDKSNQKSLLEPFFSSKEKNEIYKKLRADKDWHDRLKQKPWKEAISTYARILFPPEHLSFAANIERIDAELHQVDQQIGAAIDNAHIDSIATDTIITGYSKQRDKLMHQRKIYIDASIDAGEHPKTYFADTPSKARIFLGKVSQIFPKVRKTPPGTFHGRPITLEKAIEVTNVLVDYYEALKAGGKLPQKPDHRLSFLLRCNSITQLHYQTQNQTMVGIKLKNWALLEEEAVFTWFFAHQLDFKRPLITLGGIQLKFTKK